MSIYERLFWFGVLVVCSIVACFNWKGHQEWSGWFLFWWFTSMACNAVALQFWQPLWLNRRAIRHAIDNKLSVE